MSVTTVPLIATKVAETSQTTQYISPGSTRTIIDKFTAVNTSGSTATITVNLVRASGTAATANVVSSAQSLAANASYTFPEVAGHVLDVADFISTIASAAGINIRASGRQVTV